MTKGREAEETGEGVSVFVDDMEAQYGRMIMCHMIADSTEELLCMANLIGLDMKWLQKRGTPHEHFDVSKRYRARALANGAIPITQRELGLKLLKKRGAK